MFDEYIEVLLPFMYFKKRTLLFETLAIGIPHFELLLKDLWNGLSTSRYKRMECQDNFPDIKIRIKTTCKKNIVVFIYLKEKINNKNAYIAFTYLPSLLKYFISANENSINEIMKSGEITSLIKNNHLSKIPFVESIIFYCNKHE